MRRRHNLREQKQETKQLIRSKRLAGDKLTEIQQEIIKAIKSDIEEKKEQTKEVPKSETILIKPASPTKSVELRSDKKVSMSTNEDGDKIMKIEAVKPNKKRDKKHKTTKTPSDPNESPTKRVRFDMSKNKVTEFFKHGKVATRIIATK